MAKFRCRHRPREYLDRFIPNRSAMGFGYAINMLTGRRGKEVHEDEDNASKSEYLKVLDEVFEMNRFRRILVFKNKPTTSVDPFPKGFLSSDSSPPKKPAKPLRLIPDSPHKSLDGPWIAI